LSRIKKVKEPHINVRNIDATLLKKLEVQRFSDQSRKKPRGKKMQALLKRGGETSDEEVDSKEEDGKLFLSFLDVFACPNYVPSFNGSVMYMTGKARSVIRKINYLSLLMVLANLDRFYLPFL
jgi:hypothetical protein